MFNILIVSEAQSYLLVSLKSRLEEAGCKVMNGRANPDELSKMKEAVDLIFIFTDEELVELLKKEGVPTGFVYLNTSLEPIESTAIIIKRQILQITIVLFVLGLIISFFCISIIKSVAWIVLHPVRASSTQITRQIDKNFFIYRTSSST